MRDGFFQRGGLWVLGQGALMFAVVVLGFHGRSVARHWFLLLGGLVLLLAAAGCGLAACAVLGRNLSPFPRPAAKARLVQHGIYSLMRHPLYSTALCAATGWSSIRQSWPALAATIALALFFDAKARREERWLRRQFPEYDRYARRVRRFIPWIY